MKRKIDSKTKEKWNVILAVALIKDLYKRGDIKKKTYHAVVKDAEQMIETKIDL